MIIEKKIWPESFNEIVNGGKQFELRLADFDLNAGDMLVLKEYDPEKKEFTGRKIEKKCKTVLKTNPTTFNSSEEIEKHGLYVIELE
jgi:hypothetical protein